MIGAKSVDRDSSSRKNPYSEPGMVQVRRAFPCVNIPLELRAEKNGSSH